MNKKILSKKALLDNFNFYQTLAPEICAVVKADAYGHGIEHIVSILKNKPAFYGVATPDEAEKVRAVCNGSNIVILDRISDFSLAEKFYVTAMSLSDIKKAIKLNVTERCFIKLCVGMNRFGIDCNNSALIKKLKELIKNKKFVGVSTHFSSTSNIKLTIQEHNLFLKTKNYLQKNLKTSFGGSGAGFLPCDILRVGIGLYGYQDKNLQKVMKLTSNIVQIRSLEKGQKAGYDGCFKAKRRTTLAIVGVGYGDGFDRNHSHKFVVQIGGKNFKLVGNMCMDSCFVDVTGGNVKVGDEVMMFTDANQMSKWTKKIPYEILTNFSNFRGKVLKN